MTPQPREKARCKYCDQPIEKFLPHPGGAGVWMHVDGHHAYPECRYLKATPKEDDDGRC